MKKLGNTESEMRKGITYKKKCIGSNCVSETKTNHHVPNPLIGLL